MGLGASKTTPPKPAGPCQTGTGRRSGSFSYVGFRSFLNSQDEDAHQSNEDHKQLELKDVLEENSFFCLESFSQLFQVSAALLDDPFPGNSRTREPICPSVSSQTSEAKISPFSVSSCAPEENQVSQNLMNLFGNFEEFTEYTGHDDLNSKNGIAFENVDSYEPGNSDRKEDDAQAKYSSLREAAKTIQGKTDNVYSLWKTPEPLNHSVSREICDTAGPTPRTCISSGTLTSAVPTADVLKINDGKTGKENSSEPAVRPEIRKQDSGNQLKREKHLPHGDEEESVSWKRTGSAYVQQCRPVCPLRDSEEMTWNVSHVSRLHSDKKNTKEDLRSGAAAENQNNDLEDFTIWEEFEVYRHFLMASDDEDSSSEDADEWAKTVATPSGKKKFSHNEIWMTTPGREQNDPEVQISSLGINVEKVIFSSDEEREEGETPWLQQKEGEESSSDGQNSSNNEICQFGNDLADDSSVSEDRDMEWRPRGELRDGLGLARNISGRVLYFLTFLALQECIEVMESTLANLEFLTCENSHPPATKETIDHLPEIVVNGDIDNKEKIWKGSFCKVGREQSCVVCCSEYVEGEIITRLPCDHLFHKSCVTLWLKRSGTCPVCRQVLALVLPEATDNPDVIDSEIVAQSATGP